MTESYRQTIARLISNIPFEIDTEIQIAGRPPSSASSEFLTNKEQGEWAETIVHSAINENSQDFVAVRYGRDDSLAAGDEGFLEFYQEYLEELNHIGKKPDLLIFRRADIPDIDSINLDNAEVVSRAVAAIEVRSSSFLSNRYAEFMDNRNARATAECERLCQQILREPLRRALRGKRPQLLSLIENANADTFRDLDFRPSSWSSSDVTPKLEDLSLVNRWIQNFGVRHYYLQVFFDKAYLISFEEILEIISNPDNEDVVFSVEQDVKNQGKTTIKINVSIGRELIGRIDMPEYVARCKELDRGRLLFYVTFLGGRGYLDPIVLSEEIN